MSDFFNRIRTSAEKAAFEADKIRRVQAIQIKIRSVKQETEKSISQVGQAAYALYQQGEVTQPELKAACDKLADLFERISAFEDEIAAVRAEVFVDTAASPQYGRLCPNGHGPIPPPNNFCQTCGAKAIEVPPPSGAMCPHCQAALLPDAAFCASCGQAVPPPVTHESTVAACPRCGAALLPDAVFCTDCGHKMNVLTAVEPPMAGDSGLDDTIPADANLDDDLASPPEEKSDADLPMADESGIDDTIPADANLADDLASPPEEMTEAEKMMDEDETAVIEDSRPPETPHNCPICQSPVEVDAVFCSECGHSLTQEKLEEE